MKANPNKDEFIWDTEAKGFGVRMKPTGTRSFVLSYYAPGLHRKRRRITIGAYGPLTVEEARRKALELLARIAAGEDPAQEALDERRSIRDETVSALFQAYLDDGRVLRRESTLAFYESLGRLYILPALGELPVARVSVQDVAKLHRSLNDRPTTANRVAQLIRGFFYWLSKRGFVTGGNPAAHVERFPETPKERFLTVEEMGRLGDAIRIAERQGLPPAPQHRKPPKANRSRNTGMFSSDPQPANPAAVAALRLLMLSGWREKEALTLRWDAVDFARGLVTLEDTKSGRSIRALPAPAMALIADQPKLAGNPYIFPGKIEGKPIQEIQRLWYAVRATAKLEGVRLHDLRHSVASIAAEQGHSLFLIGKLLGHKDQRSTARYAHLADDARKAIADSVGAQINQALSASAGAITDAVPILRLRSRP